MRISDWSSDVCLPIFGLFGRKKCSNARDIVRLAKTGDVVQPEKALFDLRSYPSFQSGGLDQAGDNPVTANSLLAEGRRDGLDIPVHHGLRRHMRTGPRRARKGVVQGKSG